MALRVQHIGNYGWDARALPARVLRSQPLCEGILEVVWSQGLHPHQWDCALMNEVHRTGRPFLLKTQEEGPAQEPEAELTTHSTSALASGFQPRSREAHLCCVGGWREAVCSSPSLGGLEEPSRCAGLRPLPSELWC